MIHPNVKFAIILSLSQVTTLVNVPVGKENPMEDVSVVLHAEPAQPPTQEPSSVPAVLLTWFSTTGSANPAI